MADQQKRWASRVNEPGLTEGQRDYAAARARRLSEPYAKRVDVCGVTATRVSCHCRAPWDVPRTCRAHLLCRVCRKQRGRRLRPKVWAALERMLQRADGRYQLVMLTLSVEHELDVGRARKRLADGWRAFYRSNVKRWGAFPYVGVHELTPGRDDLGHPHAHVVALWPVGGPGDRTQGDWELQCKLWTNACPSSKRIRFSASKTPTKAARYLSKYVSKGVQPDDFTPQLRARVLAGTYAQRWIFTSRRAWVPFQPCCKSCGVPVRAVSVAWHESPSQPPDASPEWLHDRGPPQQLLWS